MKATEHPYFIDVAQNPLAQANGVQEVSMQLKWREHTLPAFLNGYWLKVMAAGIVIGFGHWAQIKRGLRLLVRAAGIVLGQGHLVEIHLR